jgi:hypothetical protein
MKKGFQVNFPWRVVLLIMWLAARPAPAATFSTIVTNGPATNRLNLVFFSEGYTNGQMGQFLIDATNAANAFLSAEPYAEYSNYFNVFAVATNSAHAGSTHLTYYPFVTNYTCFNSTYEAPDDLLITIPPNTADANNLDGQGKINALMQIYLPSTNNDLSALLVNDPVEGGSDGGSSDYGKTAIASIAGISVFLIHESGHTLGGLGDEYTEANPGFPNVEEPNTTTNTTFTNIQWKAWISTNTPLPTETTNSTYEYTVGLFQGAHYNTTGWYRPFYDCGMNHYGVGFCPVCQEALVLAIYGKARPMDSRSPATNSLNTASSQMLSFSLNLLQPATHNLNVQWLTNSLAVGGATNPVFNIWPAQLGNGTNKIEADVWDATGMVRTDAKNLLKQTNVWTLNLTLLQIDSLTWLTNGSFTFRVTGTVTNGVAIQVSTNLVQWTAVQTNYFKRGKIFYTNSGAAALPKRFYRAEVLP